MRILHWDVKPIRFIDPTYTGIPAGSSFRSLVTYLRANLIDQSNTLGELKSMAGEGVAVEYVTFRLDYKHLMAPRDSVTLVCGYAGQTLHGRRVA